MGSLEKDDSVTINEFAQQRIIKHSDGTVELVDRLVKQNLLGRNVTSATGASSSSLGTAQDTILDIEGSGGGDHADGPEWSVAIARPIDTF